MTSSGGPRHRAASSGVPGINIARSLFPSLWHHFRRVRFSGHASRAQLLALLVILGLARLPLVHLPLNADAFIINLPAWL